MTEEVEQALVACFDSTGRNDARSRLPGPDELPVKAPYERVLTAIIWLSQGSLERLDHFSQVARVDWRDVVHWSEDPVLPGEPRTLEDVQKRLGIFPSD
jgi:hypothetical protein